MVHDMFSANIAIREWAIVLAEWANIMEHIMDLKCLDDMVFLKTFKSRCRSRLEAVTLEVAI
jgi:hypothetical protein